MERVGGFGARMVRHPSASLARDCLQEDRVLHGIGGSIGLKTSMEQRHARERAEIEVELISMCTVRLGEDKASEEGPLGVKKQGDGPCLYNLAREQDDGLGSYHFTKDGTKRT